MKKALKKVFKSELTYILTFLSIYLGTFLSSKAAISFIISFLLVLFINKYKGLFKNKSDILYPILYLLIYLLSLKMSGTQYLVGFLLGASSSAFLLNNLIFSKNNSNFKEKEALDTAFVLKISLIIQAVFSFNYFYNLIIQDVRGQNRLDNNLVTISIALYLGLIPVIQLILKKLFIKKVDFISYLNIVFIINLLISVGIFYKTFLEIGSLKVIIPVVLSYLSILLLSLITHYISPKQFKFKRTLSTFAYIAIPGLLLLYYPWSIGNYLSTTFSFLALAVFLNTLFLNKTNTNLELRVSTISTFAINLFLLLFGIFNLSAKGIITRVNIANINYLIMLILGAFFIMLIRDLRDAIKNTLLKKNLESTYSILVMALTGFTIFLILDLGGVESLISFIMGILAITLIKNIFEERTKESLKYNALHRFLENNLINLLTTISLSLVLVKI